MPCSVCGQPDYISCNCNAEPYCEQCSEDSICIQKIDAECVIYHRDNTSPSKLICSGLPNQTSIEAILESFDSYLCNINAIQTPITVYDSPSIDLTAWGTLKHTLQADVIISPDADNGLEIRSNGLYAIQSSGSTGTDTDITYTSDNGLTKTVNNFQLGGTLLHDTDIATTNRTLNILTDGGHFNFAPTYYIAGVQDGVLTTSNQLLQVHNATINAFQCATLADLALIAFYSNGFSSTGKNEVVMAVHYPQSNDLMVALPAVDPLLTAYVKVSKNISGGQGLIELYSKDIIINQAPNTLNDTGTNPQSNVLYTNSIGKVCSAPFKPTIYATGSTTVGFVATNTSIDISITVTGVVTTDVVSVQVDLNPVNTCWTAYVSAANTIKLRLNNYSTGGGITPGTINYRLAIFPTA